MAVIDVNTWEGFLSAVTNAEDTVNITGDIVAEPVTSQINIYATVEGNDYKIINLSLNSTTACLVINGNNVKNLHFVNIVSTKGSPYVFFRTYGKYGYFEGCSFAGIVKSSFINDGNNANSKYPMSKNCSFALRGYDSNFTYTRKSTLLCCDFMLYGTWKTDCCFGNLVSCRIRGGNISSIATSSSYNNFDNCVIDAVINADTSLTATNSIINTDKVTGSISGGLIGVTSEQMIDIEYLNSIGFEVFPDVDSA